MYFLSISRKMKQIVFHVTQYEEKNNNFLLVIYGIIL